METQSDYSLKLLNSFHVEARAASYVRFERETDIVEFLTKNSLQKQPCLVLGGGSNLLFVDDVDGVVLHPLLKGIQVLDQGRQAVRVRAMAGENWDDLVAFAVSNGWGGIENLSLIPGSVGASVVQNIGAYGVEVNETVHSIEAVSLQHGNPIVFFPDECGFEYRTSHFKGLWAEQFIITAVTFKLRRRPEFILDYTGVKPMVEAMGEVSLRTIREAIIAIRRSKLPDPDKIGNAGSFFKNPVVDSDTLAALIDRFPDIRYYSQQNRLFKLAAGWMIEQCGFKGKQFGRAAVHERQALVLVNRGGATGQDILALSERVRDAIDEKFGIRLEREVQVVPS